MQQGKNKRVQNGGGKRDPGGCCEGSGREAARKLEAKRCNMLGVVLEEARPPISFNAELDGTVWINIKM